MSHTPTPREYELPTGDLAVAQHVGRWMFDTRAVTVPAEKRPLYDLLMDVLADTHVPDLMPANLARECSNLVEARQTVESIDRGRSDFQGVGYGMSYCYRARDAIVAHRDRDPIRLVAVGCSGTKDETDDPLPAKDRYGGGYWTNKRQYYEASCDDDGKIISAEHDLLDPETPIDYYETTPDDLRGIPVDHDGRLPNGDRVQTKLDAWAFDVHIELTRWIREVANGIDPRDVVLEILLGKSYEKPLRDRGVFGALRIQGDLEVSFPFRTEVDYSDGGGVGKQRSWMADEVQRAAVATDGGDPQ
ncbi:DUF6884 domain-containing protein [Halomontanus rarus]|uniref:DUF6884 domain-containing protein n=1 Tax=Halomontanus rarus TaxID=3034020 RepID=UPI0023E8304B|nr:DUF6884 domain-containing protein [Halovivax sp. TS33]